MAQPPHNANGIALDDAYTALLPLLNVRHPDIHFIPSAHGIQTKGQHGVGLKIAKTLFGVSPLGLLYGLTGRVPRLVREGHIALTWNNGHPEFLGPGWHYLASPLRSFSSVKRVTENSVIHGTLGLVTVPPGSVGYIEDRGQGYVLGPGMHQWESSTISYKQTYDISEKLVTFGPYTLVTVREGECAVTSNNGELIILGWDGAREARDVPTTGAVTGEQGGATRTYLLDHPKWIFVAWLSTTEQFDPLKSASLLTSDRVEVDLEATVAWRIVDPVIAAKQGGGMTHIQNLVHREARATVADMILSTKISSGITAPSARSKHTTNATTVAPADGVPVTLVVDANAEAAAVHEEALNGGISDNAVEMCSHRLRRVGVTVDTINIVQLDIRHGEVRDQLAQAAVISTKVHEQGEVARVEASNVGVLALAEATSIERLARAKANALRMHAEAAHEAGECLATSQVAQRLEQIRVTGEALGQTKSTLFMSPGQDMHQLMAIPDTARVNMPAPEKHNSNFVTPDPSL